MITLLATGGTIASVDSPQGRRVGASGADLLRQARTVWDLPDDVRVVETRSLISSALGVDDVADLAARCGTDHPAVITHGTDAMEETALALSLFRSPGDPPVVLTGAQRPFDDPTPDGPRNLAAALRWAGSPAARGTGVTVVFGDQVLPAIGVRKVHTLSLTGFAAPGRGPIAVVDEAGLRKFSHPCLPPPLLGKATLPPVEQVHVLPTYVGQDAGLVDSIIDAGARGIVVEAMGAGNAPPPVTSRLVRALNDGVPVAVTSRTGSGATTGLYAGGGADLARAGALFCGDLSTVQARWVLAASLTAGEAWRDVVLEWLRAAGCVGQSD